MQWQYAWKKNIRFMHKELFYVHCFFVFFIILSSLCVDAL